MKVNKVESTNVITYRGRVTVQFLKGKKCYKTLDIKNSGTLDFFRILCNAVIGNNCQDQMPNCIGIIGTAQGGTSDTNLTSVRVHYTTATVSETLSQCYAEFSFVIPGTMLRSGTAKKLRLYNSTSDTAGYLAEVSLGSSEQFDISAGSNLMITWNLSFQDVEG